MDFRESGGGNNSLEVLLVEDNPADAVLVRTTLQQRAMPHRLTIVPDGVEAMRYLRKEAPYANAKTPHLVLLDLNLPRKGGIEVLAEVKADPLLKIIPVIVLTSSGAAQDIVMSYALGANAYLKKPGSLEATCDLFNTMQHFWMNLVALPNRVERAY
jgi:two-component system, chemotaxis family, response regulator Rcp1